MGFSGRVTNGARASCPGLRSLRALARRRRARRTKNEPTRAKTEGDGRALFAMPDVLPTTELTRGGVAKRVGPNILSVAHWISNFGMRALRAHLSARVVDPSRENVRDGRKTMCPLRRKTQRARSRHRRIERRAHPRVRGRPGASPIDPRHRRPRLNARKTARAGDVSPEHEENRGFVAAANARALSMPVRPARSRACAPKFAILSFLAPSPRPIFDTQAGHPLELPLVIGNDCQLAGDRLRRDQCVERSNGDRPLVPVWHARASCACTRARERAAIARGAKSTWLSPPSAREPKRVR